MSNLLKQYYVVQQPNCKRVINSNVLAQERIRAQKTETSGFPPLQTDSPGEAGEDLQDESGGFSSGIVAEQIEVERQPDPDEAARQILADAQAQADQILADAQAQAKQALEDANIQAKAVYEEQKKQGYADGSQAREEELAELERSLTEQKAELEKELITKKSELDSEFQMRMEELEGDIVDALIPVFEKVFCIQLSDKREILLALINNTLMNVEVGNKVRIRTNDADREMLLEHLDEIRARAGADVSVELLQDGQMSDGQCQIETSYGVFDCGIDMEFQNLVQAIRALV